MVRTYRESTGAEKRDKELRTGTEGRREPNKGEYVVCESTVAQARALPVQILDGFEELVNQVLLVHILKNLVLLICAYQIV